jgi:hypothetical protein
MKGTKIMPEALNNLPYDLNELTRNLVTDAETSMGNFFSAKLKSLFSRATLQFVAAASA